MTSFRLATSADAPLIASLTKALTDEIIERTAARHFDLDLAATTELARTLHKLAGTAGMFGEEDLGARAAALERALLAGVEEEVRRRLAAELLEAA